MAIPKNTDPQFKLRLPNDLLQALAGSANANNRSTNAEIVARLEASGETLRDRFAMAALTGYLSRAETDDHNYDEIVDWCFDAADAAMGRRKYGGAA